MWSVTLLTGSDLPLQIKEATTLLVIIFVHDSLSPEAEFLVNFGYQLL